MTKVCFVCLGNICRSPMAEYILKDMLDKAFMTWFVEVDSRATSTEEEGNPIYPPARATLAKHGILVGDKRATQFKKEDYNKYDYIIIMDSNNEKSLMRIIGEDTDNKVKRLLEYAGNKEDIADPWYTGDFDTTWEQIELGCKGLMAELMLHLNYD